MDLQLVEQAVAEAVVDQRLTGAGLPTERVRALTRPPEFKTIQLTAQGAREDRKEAFFVVLILMLTLLYTSIAMWGAAIMNGVLEEKTSRVVEVIVSSITTSDLFGGKLLGVGAAGPDAVPRVGVARSALLGLDGRPPAAPPRARPVLDAGVLACRSSSFFLLGYFFYGALFAALGAAVNSPAGGPDACTFLVMLPAGDRASRCSRWCSATRTARSRSCCR